MPEIQGDSLSRCSQDTIYHNRDLYSSASPERSQKRVAYGNDKLESAEDKMEREALKKIFGGNGQLMNRSLVVLGQVGKFTFLVVMLPAYLFLYQVPKWMLLEAFPQLFQSTVKVIQNLNEFMKRILSFVIAKTSSLTNFTKVLKLENIAQFLQPLNARAKQVFAALMRGANRLGVNFAAFVQKHGKKVLERTQLVAAKISGTLSPPFRKVKHKIAETLKTITGVAINVGVQNIVKTMQAGFRAVGRGIKNLGQVAKSGAKELFAKVKEAPKVAAETVINAVQTVNQYAVQPMLNLMISTAKLFADSASKGSAWMAKELIRQAAKLRDKALSFIKELPRKVSALFNAAENMTFKILDPILQGILPPLQNLVHKFREFMRKSAKQGASFAKAVAANAVAFIKEKASDLLDLLLRKLFELMKTIQRILKKFATEAPRKIRAFCISTLQSCRRGVSRLFILLRNFFKWTALLCRHSMQRVRLIALNLEHRFLPGKTNGQK